MKYLDLPATCRVLLHDNGDADTVVVMLGDADPANHIGILDMAKMPGQECQVVARAIRESEDEPKHIYRYRLELDDDAGDRAREAEAEETHRHGEEQARL